MLFVVKGRWNTSRKFCGLKNATSMIGCTKKESNLFQKQQKNIGSVFQINRFLEVACGLDVLVHSEVAFRPPSIHFLRYFSPLKFQLPK